MTSFMDLALSEARAAGAAGEVPVGCVIVRDNAVVAKAANRTIMDRDPTAHAELLAIRAAAAALGSERLSDCDLYVTLEPCAMCAAAMSFARLRRLYYGAAVNPLPFDCLRGLADVVLAVDCSGGPDEIGGIPDPWAAMFTTLGIMGQTIVAEKLKAGGPDLVIRPNVGIFRLLDFFQASAILRAAEPAKAEVKGMLPKLLEL